MSNAACLDSTDYARMERAIVFLASHFREQPDLRRVAEHVALSSAHFNRLFRRWAGVTPKQFLQRLTLDAAQYQLQQAHSVMRASLESGLSGPGRLHDLFVTLEAMTPGEYKSGGVGLALTYGMAATPFGPALWVWSERGLCHLEFVVPDAQANQEALLRNAWPNARWQRDDQAIADRSGAMWQGAHGAARPLRLLVNGSNFQLQVWRALLKLDAGQFTDYGALAAQIDRPSAARAVGNAVGANPLLYLVPCHRVLRANGALGGYRGGLERKQLMLAWEYARSF